MVLKNHVKIPLIKNNFGKMESTKKVVTAATEHCTRVATITE
jgi:hypothetical protein